MSEVLEFLQQRNSAARLTEPAPEDDELHQILRAAVRAPDHAWLRPWRFISLRGDRRSDFGDVLAECLQQRDPEANEAAQAKARQAPLRAPLLLVVVARLTDHPKVPPIEQRLSAGCAAYGVLLAAEAMGYAGIWRTGAPAFDRRVMDALGLEGNEEITGFLYLGTSDGPRKPVPDLPPEQFISTW